MCDLRRSELDAERNAERYGFSDAAYRVEQADCDDMDPSKLAQRLADAFDLCFLDESSEKRVCDSEQTLGLIPKSPYKSGCM